MSGITTHVLDVAHGRPAAGVRIILESVGAAGNATRIGEGVTDSDGRLRTLTSAATPLVAGAYRLRFSVGPYFEQKGVRSFFDEVPIEFRVDAPAEHYHVPLLVSPFGYSTYRGS